MSKNIARKATTGFLALMLTTGAGVGLATAASAAPVTGGTVATKNMSSTRVVSSPDGWAAIRKGPGTKYTKVGRLNNGAKVTVYETKGGWSRIGKCQWVASWLLKPVGQQKPSKPGNNCKDKCSSGCDKGCPAPAPAPKQICRVFVGKYTDKSAAECDAKDIGGGAFVVQMSDGRWTIQAGSFEVKANAENLANSLGMHARVECTKS